MIRFSFFCFICTSVKWVRASARNPPVPGGAKSDNVGQALCLPSLKGGISVAGAVILSQQ